MVAKSDIILSMNRTHRKTLAAVFADPISGNIEWRKIETLFKAAGCEIIEGSGSRIAFHMKVERRLSTARIPARMPCATRYAQPVNSLKVLELHHEERDDLQKLCRPN